MGRCPNNRKKGTKGLKGFKVERRGKFLSRHMDLVWEDVRKEVPVHNDKAGPIGNMVEPNEHDEDIAGFGQHYCTPCSRYFQRLEALSTHQKTKAHKKRIKELQGAKPHVQADAEAAAGMGKVDNGPKLRSSGAVPEQMALEGMAF